MWYRTSRIKSLPSGQLYADYFGDTLKINPEEYFTVDYDFQGKLYSYPPEKKPFNLERDYPLEFNSPKLTITAINKFNNEPAAFIEILFSQWYPNYAVVDDITILNKKNYTELAKAYNQKPMPEDFSYAKHGLANLLYKKTVEWINENKPEVEYLTGFISSKEAYKSRINALGKPDFTRPRDYMDIPEEHIEQFLEPAIIKQNEINYPMNGPQFEVRHKIKDSSNTNPSTDKT